MASADEVQNCVAEDNGTNIVNGTRKSPELEVKNYDDMFPALPSTGSLTNGTIDSPADNTVNNSLRINTTTVTQAFCIPADERKQDANDKFGESESVRICLQIMNETGAHIELSTSKDRSSTFLISGRQNNVNEAKRRVINSFQTLASTSINIPKDHHRSVLGKSGEKLKSLEKATGTKITVPSISSTSESIVVTGTRDGIEKALHEIKVISDERCKKDFVRLSIPKVYHPFINGSNGEFINNLMSKTNTRINMPPFHVNNDEITIVGDKNGVNQAKKSINEAYNNAKTRCQEVVFPLDKYKHKFVVGQRKAGLREIIEKTGVSVEMPSADDESNIIKLQGPHMNVADALSMIMKRADAIKCVILDVDRCYHRLIIGKKGCFMRELQEIDKQVNIELSENQIKIDGPADSVDEVKAKIESKIKFIIDNYDFAELSVDTKYLKHIIGKSGANVNKLKSENDVDIIIEDGNSDVIRIEGFKANVAKATSELRNIITRLENEVEREIKIEPKYHPVIIGTRGERIKEIQEKFDVLIRFPGPIENGKANIVKIRGMKEKIDQCHAYMTSLVEELIEQQYTLLLPVCKQLHKFIIGKGGSTIKKIKDETNTRIELPAEDEADDKISIVGQRKNVEEARDRIQKIEQEMQNLDSIEVTIPAKYHSGLRASKTVQTIRDERVSIKFPPAGSNIDKVYIRGPSEDVQKAKQRLLNAVTEMQVNSFTVTLQANPEHFKFLIGKNGSNIKKYTGVRITFPDERKRDDNDNVIIISGKKDAVLKAKSELTKTMNNLTEDMVDVDQNFYKYFMISRRELLQTINDEYGGNEKLHIIFPKFGQTGSVTLKGYKDSVKGAKQRIINEVEQMKSYTILYVPMSKECAKSLSRYVSDMDGIREKYRVRLAWEKSPNNSQDTTHNGNGSPNGENGSSSEYLAIVGRRENCEKAKKEVMDIMPVEKEIEVPCKYHGHIIGRSGSTIAEIVGDSDVFIDIPSQNQNSDIIKVRGKICKVDAVIERLQNRIKMIEVGNEEKKLRSYQETVHVEPAHRPYIIGRKGDRINKIRKKFGVTINLPTKGDCETKNVVITGLKDNVLAAVQEIKTILDIAGTRSRTEVKIDSRIHFRLIGTHGNFVKELMDEYEVDIKFPHNDANTDPDIVIVIGEETKVKECIDYMHYLESEFLKDIVTESEKSGTKGGNHRLVNGDDSKSKIGSDSLENKVPNTASKADFPDIK